MSADLIAAIIVAVSTLMATVLQIVRTAGGGMRSRIRHDLDIWERLPDASPSKQILAEYIDIAVANLVYNEDKRSRSPLGIGLGLALIGLGLAGLYLIVRNGGWWYLISPLPVIIAVLGAGGFAQDVAKTERDERGRPIRARGKRPAV